MQKLLVNNFEWIEDNSKFNEEFIKSYSGESNEGYFLKVDVQNPERIYKIHNNLPFLPEGMKIEKVEKLVTNLCEYVIHIRNLQQVLDLGLLVLKKLNKTIKFKQNARLKSYIDMNTDLRENHGKHEKT